ncbi:hypothetical protein BATDEDRAFT_91521 [Batrachochytrium dendrobatidis JAM81]|uniref:U2A'/phosphoprotein 32 family A C-terminal domain-containing protein n=1 Tax=Batrachochytrium dendrobatidis (strain JAM81 / FGSC 10211) TaxID=684364 RepID=F4PAI2_BATDJ|nr:uncharacterized protein BATDEDRAFT_91521 [Batrachochytrium dendrobatidis JAM81]EGF77690.1 hypothetical protein BATDEDRAFT_91521 [Batrachochytrium dendrobatidis JAM81]|eukprot:XP_006681803.1 hypothetical protein BATDEDRAFT_91521 [Batrachochytrium dendrobatidis JAM81]
MDDDHDQAAQENIPEPDDIFDDDPSLLSPTLASTTEDAVENSQIENVPLTADLMAKSMSLITRTGNGLTYAYARVEIHEAGITSLDSIEAYPHLRYVDCAHNKLDSIDALNGLEYLLSFNVSSNCLKTIPSVLENKRYLQHVNVSKNQLTEFKIQSWPILSWLNLNDNMLKELSLPGFPELLHLEARGNSLSDGITCNTPKLQRLYLAENGIATITGLENKSALQLLHLRGNKIELLDWVTQFKMPSLTYLNLRANKISSLAQVDALKTLDGLRILILSENPLDQIEGYRLEVIGRLPHLQRLDKDLVIADEREDAINANSCQGS